MSDVRFRVEPLDGWGDVETPAGQRQRPQFSAGWEDTVRLLTREVALLGAREVVCQIDVDPRDVRKTDGLPSARARYGEFPGARVTFDSRHGPLVYGTDVYLAGGRWRSARELGNGTVRPGRQSWMPAWQANVRAIALGLEALRAVDRYGVTRRGQQYAGFRALPAGGIAMGGAPARAFPSADAAARWLAEQLAVLGDTADPDGLVRDPEALRQAWRRLARAAHPDVGGDRSQWERLQAAKEIVESLHT